MVRSLRPARIKKPGRRTAPDFGPEPAYSRGSEEEYYGTPLGGGLAGGPAYGGPPVAKRTERRHGAGGSAEPDELDEAQQDEADGAGDGEAGQLAFDFPDWSDEVDAERDAFYHEVERDDWEPVTPLGDGAGVAVVQELSDGEPEDMGTAGADLPDWPTEGGPLPDVSSATGNSSGLAWPDDLMAGELEPGAVGPGLGEAGEVPDLGVMPDLSGWPPDVDVALDLPLADLTGIAGVPEIADPFAPGGEGKASDDPFGGDPFAGWEFDKPGNAW
jgi:hypothetical protein